MNNNNNMSAGGFILFCIFAGFIALICIILEFLWEYKFIVGGIIVACVALYYSSRKTVSSIYDETSDKQYSINSLRLLRRMFPDQESFPSLFFTQTNPVSKSNSSIIMDMKHYKKFSTTVNNIDEDLIMVPAIMSDTNKGELIEGLVIIGATFFIIGEEDRNKRWIMFMYNDSNKWVNDISVLHDTTRPFVGYLFQNEDKDDREMHLEELTKLSNDYETSKIHLHINDDWKNSMDLLAKEYARRFNTSLIYKKK